MEVKYPSNWSDDEFEKGKLVFKEAYNYQVKEIPTLGYPTILDAKVVSEDGGWSKLRLETNAGSRELCCKSIELSD